MAIEGEDGKLGRVRFQCAPAADAEHIEQFARDYVEPGSHVVTDGLPSYGGLPSLGFIHRPYVLSSGGENAGKELDHVHLAVSLLKRWLLGTHQGAATPNRLQAYLDEFAFRFNRRLSTHRGKLFYRLIQQSVTLRPKGVKELYVKKPQDTDPLELIS